SLTAHTLVIGAHDRHARLGSILGSVSQGVLHHAACPVVVVHADTVVSSTHQH
ncbi:MAG: universal stress protein, partial [Geodermatophilaceae bacterium]|nr:universal stress protein [Geodermatophilaceae bacterium]